MKNFKEKLRKYIADQIIELRKSRGSKFLYLPNDLHISKLSEILKEEFFANHNLSDELIIKYTIENLENKKIIYPKGVSVSTYDFENIKYYDVNIKTINNRTYSRGTSIDKNEAYAKAIGEVLERVSINFPSEKEYKEKIIIKKVGDTKDNKNFFDLEKCAKPTNEQQNKFPNFVIQNEDVFSWTQVRNIFTAQNIYVPSQMIFFGKLQQNIEKDLIQSTTHGAGAGHTEFDAFRSCLFEITHRHFFLKSWYQKQSPSKIDINTIPNGNTLYTKIKEMKNKDFKIYFLDYTPESKIPTIICLLEIFGGWYCGGSTNFTLIGAMERSLDEALSIYIWLTKTLLNKKNKMNPEKINNILPNFAEANGKNILEKCLAFGNKYYLDRLDKFIIAGDSINYNNKNDIGYENMNIDFLKKIALENFGQDIFIFQKENNYLKNMNYHVAKMYIPNSYYFPLNDIYARPIIYDKITPIYQGINPFP